MKMQPFSPETLLKAAPTQMFSCKYSIAKFLGTPVLQDICEQLFERFAT